MLTLYIWIWPPSSRTRLVGNLKNSIALSELLSIRAKSVSRHRAIPGIFLETSFCRPRKKLVLIMLNAPPHFWIPTRSRRLAMKNRAADLRAVVLCSDRRTSRLALANFTADNCRWGRRDASDRVPELKECRGGLQTNDHLRGRPGRGARWIKTLKNRSATECRPARGDSRSV